MSSSKPSEERPTEDWTGELRDPDLEEAFGAEQLEPSRQTFARMGLVLGAFFLLLGVAAERQAYGDASMGANLALRFLAAAVLVVGVLVGRRVARPSDLSRVYVTTMVLVLGVYLAITVDHAAAVGDTQRPYYAGLLMGGMCLAVEARIRHLVAGGGLVLLAQTGVALVAPSRIPILSELQLALAALVAGTFVAARLKSARRTEWWLRRREREARAALEQDNASLSDDLVRAQKLELLGRLAGGVAHDLANVLQAIRGHLSMLEGEITPRHPAFPDIEGIAAATDRGARMVRQLLSLGRRVPGERRRCDLIEVVQGILPMLRRLLPRGVELNPSFAMEGAFLRADRSQLEQVLLNLAVNARDAMPGGGRIEIRVEAGPEGAVALVVEDTGSGIPEAVRARMFEPFFTTKGVGQGTGLGLYTVKRIVESQDGTISVRSRAGHGTRFTVVLPLDAAPDDASSASSVARRPPGLSRRRLRMMVVEDDPVILRLTSRALRRAGHVVVEHRDALGAATALDGPGAPFDGVVTDVDMPVGTGLELYESARQRDGQLPVVFVTGRMTDEVASVVDADPFAALIGKPFGIGQVVDALERLCALRRSGDPDAPGGTDSPGPPTTAR